MKKSELPIPLMHLAYRYDENGCWSDFHALDLDETEQSFLNPLLDHGPIRPNEPEALTGPTSLRGKLQALPAELTELSSRPALSYITHDGRELSLMLAGDKPFASFHVGPGETLEDVTWRSEPWDEHVKSGAVLRYETSFGRDPSEAGTAILFALPEEAWRLKAYELLFRHCLEFGFPLHVEPMFGSLWGYSDDQNREFLELSKKLRALDL